MVQLLGMKLNVHHIPHTVIRETGDAGNSSGPPSQHGAHFYVAPVISQKWAELLAEQSKLLGKCKADAWLLRRDGLGAGLGIGTC